LDWRGKFPLFPPTSSVSTTFSPSTSFFSFWGVGSPVDLSLKLTLKNGICTSLFENLRVSPLQPPPLASSWFFCLPVLFPCSSFASDSCSPSAWTILSPVLCGFYDFCFSFPPLSMIFFFPSSFGPLGPMIVFVSFPGTVLPIFTDDFTFLPPLLWRTVAVPPPL